MRQRLLAWAVLAGTLLIGLPRAAHADDMDLALERLVQGDAGACAATLEDPPVLRDPTTGDVLLRPDDDAWAALMAELNGATLPSLLQPVTTSGPSGVDVLFGQTFTGIRSQSRYWERGTRGSGRGSQRDCSGINRAVNRFLTRSELRMIKSLPFGISLGATLGKLWDTELWTFGGELKVALVEGYRKLAVPDIALRVAANTVVGDGQYSLTNLAASLLLSKPFVVAQLMRIAPYVAYQAGIGFARSRLIDLTPHTDAFDLCDDPPPTQTGRYECSGGEGADLAYDQTFRDLTLVRHQLAAGLVLRYRVATLTAEFLIDLVPLSKSDSQVPSAVSRQWRVGISPGVSF